MARETVAVSGLTSLIRDFKTFDRPVNTAMRKTLRDVGDIVRHDAQSSFAHVNSRSAAGFKTRVASAASPSNNPSARRPATIPNTAPCRCGT